MSGSLAVPNTFQTQSGNVPASEIDDDFSTIETYVNAREVTVGLIGARPAAGTAGRWFLATDVNGGTLYADDGTSWNQAAAGVDIGDGIPQTLDQQVGATQVTGTVTETSLKSFVVPAGTLGTNADALQVEAHFRVSADAFTKRFRLKFGGTTVADSGAVFNGSALNQGVVRATIMRISATSQTCLSASAQSVQAQTWDNTLGGGTLFTTPGETLSGGVTLDFTAELGNTAAQAICELLQVVKWPAV